ncbi:MAG: hypothetical protein RMJ03_03145 [Nitrososphaerota archaeon]|nr:hypothetical protein [Nitrososphaerota archaeon]
MFAYGIFKVLYAPHETFKEVAQNPKYFGPMLIMVLFVIANLGSAYVIASKTYVETTEPSLSLEKRDLWTENKSFWQPLDGAQCTENSMDYVAGVYYGSRSIEFWVEQSERIAMELHGIGVNCSVNGGYTRLYLRVKWTSPSYPPQNASLHFYSGSTSFYRNLTSEFSNATVNSWRNLTINLADERWLRNPLWGNVTGLKLELVWNQTSNIRVLVDGLFFGGVFKPYVENVPGYIASYAAYSFMQFFLRWFLLGGMIYVLTKVFKAKTVWRVTLILAGFALITMFVQAAISAAAFSALPTLKYPFEFIGGVEGEAKSAYGKILEETWLVNQVYSVVQMVMLMWTVVLCTIAIHLTAELSWTTSLLTAFAAYLAALFIEGFLTM